MIENSRSCEYDVSLWVIIDTYVDERYDIMSVESSHYPFDHRTKRFRVYARELPPGSKPYCIGDLVTLINTNPPVIQYRIAGQKIDIDSLLRQP